ncbi:MAG: hypothetical protein A2599_00585 [Candidatus Staskawiczbacteria bacterium RIFOXYD1_FULL_39_28]|uniref:Uncharacterized protein n=1 Tax=Candidatus Staskawiczbacteria bacterium RIFOXYC1_FULL_38_18 TaxID=1802229 RepID=A0A1G2JCJ7_9BACT|nr:MAG: hypothetical protein A2401_00010 [Candidatus Staskawiczbacteria bacterium RIFOXYC1_FULL_38_18]OGZ90866.1 MAG: hypothetical protein A2599_00585 [Candidatus Staskawiczbacteria bacterium RIFOXYD1_FULL_39_28]
MSKSNPEQKEPAETTDLVMEKLEDINRKGLAYSVVSRESEHSHDNLKWALSNGLANNEGVYFNITGRAQDMKSGRSEMSRSYWFRSTEDAVAIIFDLNNCEEINLGSLEITEKNREYTPQFHQFRKIENYLKNGVIPADDPHFEEFRKTNLISETGRPNPDSEFGFKSTIQKLEQSEFKGVVVKGSINLNAIIAQMEKSNCLLPVYDENGNLLWPKQMSHEEVKQFVAVRDAEKDKNI